MVASKSTSTVTINAAFLQEIKEVNAALWELLAEAEQLCSDSYHHLAENSRRFVILLASLRDNLAMHFALEEAYGYFDDPLHVEPRLSVKADSLRDEHKSLFKMIRNLADDVEQQLYDKQFEDCAPKTLKRFRAYYDALQQHEMRENELILQAYDDDIGVGD